MSTDRPSRPAKVGGVALVLAAAAGLALPVPIASAAPVEPGSATVSVTAKDPAATALRAAKVTVSGGRPATIKRSRWTLPVSGSPAAGTTAVDLSGRLKFARGKRNVSFTSLRLTLGKKPAISGKAGKMRVTILTLSGAPKRDAGARTISLKNATTSLSPAAVRILRTKLATSRVKSGRLGKTTVAVRVAAAAAPSGPATPAPVVPVPQPPTPVVPAPPAPPVPPTPDPPAPPCWAATPAGSTDWIACDQPGGSQFGLGNLRSWINYIRFPGWGDGSIVVAPGASQVAPYDFRFTAGQAVGDGNEVTVPHTGRITYSLPSHGGLLVWIENLSFRVNAARTVAQVSMQAHSTPRDGGSVPVERWVSNAIVVDLTASTSRTTHDGSTTYEHAPASLTAAGQDIWPGAYAVGAPWGAFTITVPDAG